MSLRDALASARFADVAPVLASARRATRSHPTWRSPMSANPLRDGRPPGLSPEHATSASLHSCSRRITHRSTTARNRVTNATIATPIWNARSRSHPHCEARSASYSSHAHRNAPSRTVGDWIRRRRSRLPRLWREAGRKLDDTSLAASRRRRIPLAVRAVPLYERSDIRTRLSLSRRPGRDDRARPAADPGRQPHRGLCIEPVSRHRSPDANSAPAGTSRPTARTPTSSSLPASILHTS